MTSLFLSYLILINTATFCIWGIDKRKAKKGKWRIKENTLLLLSLLGGRLGAIIGVDYFKHKTIKSRFIRKVYCIALLRIIGFILIIVYT